jgi:hypothetical protein
MNYEHLTTLSQIQNAVRPRIPANFTVLAVLAETERRGTVDTRLLGSVVYDPVFVSRAVVTDIKLRNYCPNELTVTTHGVVFELLFKQTPDLPEVFEVVVRRFKRKA